MCLGKSHLRNIQELQDLLWCLNQLADVLHEFRHLLLLDLFMLDVLDLLAFDELTILIHLLHPARCYLVSGYVDVIQLLFCFQFGTYLDKVLQLQVAVRQVQILDWIGVYQEFSQVFGDLRIVEIQVGELETLDVTVGFNYLSYLSQD